MKKLILLAATLVFAGCGSVPQGPDEARTWFRTSDNAVRKEYTIEKLSLSAAETKLRAFGDKCLSRMVTQTSPTHSEWGGHTTYNYTYKPKVERVKGRVTMYLLLDAPGMVGVPKEGLYKFIVEVTPAKPGVSVFSARLKSWGDAFDLGNILDDMESWLRGPDQFCPKIT